MKGTAKSPEDRMDGAMWEVVKKEGEPHFMRSDNICQLNEMRREEHSFCCDVRVCASSHMGGMTTNSWIDPAGHH